MTGAMAQLGRRREWLVGAWAVAAALLLLMLSAACVLLAIRRPPSIDLGRVTDFPPGTVVLLTLDTTFRDPAPPTVGRSGFSPPLRPALPVWLVHDSQAGWIALINRDPRNGCGLAFYTPHLINPCSGATYTRTGEYVRGPAERTLDQLAVRVTWTGRVVIDPQRVELGTPLP